MIGEWLAGLVRTRTGTLVGTVVGVAITVGLIVALAAFMRSSAAEMTLRATGASRSTGRWSSSPVPRSTRSPWRCGPRPGSPAPRQSAMRRRMASRRPAAAPCRSPDRGRSSVSTPPKSTSRATSGLSSERAPATPRPADRGQSPCTPRRCRHPPSTGPAGCGGHDRRGRRPAQCRHDVPGDRDAARRRTPGASRQCPHPSDGEVARALRSAGNGPARQRPPPDARGARPLRSPHRARARLPPGNQPGPQPRGEERRRALLGDNLAASLDTAREDALYAHVLFLFLGAPGATSPVS